MFDTKSQQRVGNDGYIWFFGVVEDIDDPLQLGRVRVRIVGDHTQSLKNIPKDSLPWAYMMNNNRSSSMQGIGDSPTGLYVLGAWVTGFYWDGIDKQQPVITHSFGGIPESIPWTPKKAEEEEGDSKKQKTNVTDEKKLSGASTGFQDPNEEFPMGHAIFEQDTNRLARNSPDDHAFEIPENLVPKQEEMIEGGLCPKKPVYGKKYYDKFDEAFVRKFAQGEEKKHKCDDTVIGASKCDTKELKVKDKKDDKCQFFITTNDHPFTIYKFINKERFIPKCKVFADPMHRDVWHEPDNPWGTKYPYNKVWEGYHKEGTTEIKNPKNKFVSESYGYNKTMENYDGSEKEGIYRKQKCGIGSWGLGEEWDSTEGAQRYHRFHPSANYFEIDNDGNEMRKIYGDSFEIDLKDKTILIKGDWNITVEGDKNELIEGDYNLQIMKDMNVDIRNDLKFHTDGKAEYHHKEDYNMRIDGNEDRIVNGDRNTSILKRDYIESVDAERRANTIVRKGAESMIDEAFKLYELKVFDMKMNVCSLDSNIKTWNNKTETKTDDIIDITEKFNSHIIDVNTLNETIGTHTESKDTHNEFLTHYNGCVDFWKINTEDFEVYYTDTLLFELGGTGGGCSTQGGGSVESPEIVEMGKVNYPETDGIQKCLKKYNECIDAAKGACTTTLKDPRTLEDYERFDWEKYHASIESCKKSYKACIEANKGKECDVCSPVPGTDEWECKPCHDPNCPSEDKEWIFYNCECKCDHKKKEEIKIDPWEDCEKIDV